MPLYEATCGSCHRPPTVHHWVKTTLAEADFITRVRADDVAVQIAMGHTHCKACCSWAPSSLMSWNEERQATECLDCLHEVTLGRELVVRSASGETVCSVKVPLNKWPWPGRRRFTIDLKGGTTCLLPAK